MSDNVYKVLFGEDAPFLGLANEKYTEYLRRGIIIKTHYETILNNVQNTYNYNTVDITWLDGQPYTSVNVPLSYPFVSNEGWGFQVKPEIGDTVIAAFMPNSRPLILRFIKRAELLQLGQLNTNTGMPILDQYGDPLPMEGKGAYKPFREIEPGEISIKSKAKSEIYQDKNGAIKFITRTQGEETQRNQEISFGSSIVEDANQEIKKDSDGNLITYEHKDIQSGYKKIISSNGNFTIQNNGWEITFNSNDMMTIKNTEGDILSIDKGTITLKNKNGDSIEIANGKIKVGANASEPMVLGETLTQFMTTIIGIFNTHTHLYSPGGGTPTDTAIPANPMILEDFMSKKVLVE